MNSPLPTADTQGFWFRPDHDSECRECGESPTVIVVAHKVPDTDLCGSCFFRNSRMSHPENWNDNNDDEVDTSDHQNKVISDDEDLENE